MFSCSDFSGQKLPSEQAYARNKLEYKIPSYIFNTQLLYSQSEHPTSQSYRYRIYPRIYQNLIETCYLGQSSQLEGKCDRKFEYAVKEQRPQYIYCHSKVRQLQSCYNLYAYTTGQI